MVWILCTVPKSNNAMHGTFHADSFLILLYFLILQILILDEATASIDSKSGKFTFLFFTLNLYVIKLSNHRFCRIKTNMPQELIKSESFVVILCFLFFLPLTRFENSRNDKRILFQLHDSYDCTSFKHDNALWSYSSHGRRKGLNEFSFYLISSFLCVFE